MAMMMINIPTFAAIILCLLLLSGNRFVNIYSFDNGHTPCRRHGSPRYSPLLAIPQQQQQPSEPPIFPSRRNVLASTAAAAALTTTWSAVPPTSNAAPTNTGLASKLSQRDASLLKNSVFNIPPSAQVYPPFLRGQWDVSIKFRGFLFPSTSIPKQKIISNTSIPGFQKCSIAAIGDVGKETETRYQMVIDERTGLEDRKVSLQSSMDGHLGYSAVREVIYDPASNPNRISLDFIPNRTRNANRIELFCNGRESELVEQQPQSGEKIFVCSEYIRQVTFGLSQEFGVARQVVGNYGHFWTWRGNEADSSMVRGNLLTAAYLDPQDPMFFDEPSKPVVVYSHDLVAKRL